MAIKNQDNPWSTPSARVKPDDLNDTVTYLENSAINQAELAVRILQANDVYVQGPNILVDEMTDSTGTKNTVNTGTTTSSYDPSNLYYILGINDEASGDTLSDPDSFTNASNAFDNDDTTFANKSSISAGTVTQTLGRTFGAKTVNFVKYACKLTQSNRHNFAKMWFQTYNGSVWSNHTTILNDTSNNNVAFDSGILSGIITVSASIQGVRIKFESDVNNTGVTTQHYLYTLEYGDYDSSSTIVCDSNSIAVDGNELGFAVSVPDSTFPTNTSMTVIISDGTNSLSAKTINTISKGCIVINDGTLAAGTLKATFTPATTDTTTTPTFVDYAINILR